MKWITRERPKIDRLACPWLIKRFIDREAEFLYVPFEAVQSEATRLKAIPYDVPGVEYTHYEDQCTFDYFVKKHGITNPALLTIATIVRAADTDRHDMAGQASGLWAITAGLSYNIKDDHELLQLGMVLYDGLYSWARHLQGEKHTQNPTEYMLLEVYRKFLKQKSAAKKTPDWVRELKGIIQDQVDTDLSLRLQDVSKNLQVHPSYLSREFSKYFDNLTFGEYMRKLRIERAIHLMESTPYSLSEIAYLCGFSDQSHFSRIFKKHTGLSPSLYKKSKLKRSKR
ncbi:chromate resistance protein ChrB domain-containing protein [Flavobacteriaceae bacterium 3-367]